MTTSSSRWISTTVSRVSVTGMEITPNSTELSMMFSSIFDLSERRIFTATLGYCFLNSAKTSGRMCKHVPSLAPTMSSPRGTRSISASAASICLRDSICCSAYFWKALPGAVRLTLPPERSKSFAPTSSSSARICDEIAGWVRKQVSAALEKLFSRATSKNVLSWSKSMIKGCHSEHSEQSAFSFIRVTIISRKLFTLSFDLFPRRSYVPLFGMGLANTEAQHIFGIQLGMRNIQLARGIQLSHQFLVRRFTGFQSIVDQIHSIRLHDYKSLD